MESGKKIYWQQVDGKTKKLSAVALTRFLIRNANEYIQQKLYKKKSLNGFDEYSRFLSHSLLTKYLLEGESEKFISHVNAATKKLRFRHLFVHSKNSKEPEQVEMLIMEGVATPYEQVFYPFMCSLKSGEIKRVKQCFNKDCNHFFLGRKNKKWCSDRCGSKLRMKNKRKKANRNSIFDFN
jgi:hypothetical protein